jgi:PPOX class probable F420-dependent enzyme
MPSPVLNPAARTALRSGHLAHLVTLNADGSPQVSVVWVGLDGDEIVSGHLGAWQKIRNVGRDPRVALSLPDPAPPGYVLRITAERVGGVGPWKD